MRNKTIGVTILGMKKRKVDFKRLMLVLVAAVMLFVAVGSVLLYGLSFVYDAFRRMTTGITLSIDESKLNVEYGSTFDPKEIILDSVGDLEVEGTVNTNQVGSYPIIYRLKDKDVQKEFKYTVTVEDHTAPSITLVDTAVAINRGESFRASSVVRTVSDPVDGSLSYSTELSNGSYTISGTEIGRASCRERV